MVNQPEKQLKCIFFHPEESHGRIPNCEEQSKGWKNPSTPSITDDLKLAGQRGCEEITVRFINPIIQPSFLASVDHFRIQDCRHRAGLAWHGSKHINRLSKIV
ncbi:hypothetical protein PGTUg99_007113 [Puccinia graminis f. sp. tritici]|uniref:Uncharacterized protein n=1 Tax=Puccinia graminis f. sp. tritici TaxID=56615 RepID=A0A5B0RD95_PUCGR|nr:hypothetical protein PGTUg99_007113 [Puccinia graminis f. sp. tritici]